MKNPNLTLADIQILHSKGDLAEAEKGYLAFIKRDARNAVALQYLGLLYAESGNLDAAQSYLEKAFAIHSNDAVLALHLASTLKAKGLLSEARQLLQQIIGIHPDFVAAFNNLGSIFFAEGNYLAAVSAYQTAIARKADYIDAYYNLGLVLNKLHREDEAMNVYQALLDLSPDHPGAQFQLGCLLMAKADYEKAIIHFQWLEERHPYHHETQSNLATCYLKLNLIKKAYLHYQKAAEVMPNDLQILFNLGVLSMRLGKSQAAIDYYLRAISLNANYFEVHNNLGVAYLAIKNKSAALLYFRKAQRMQPNNQAVAHTIHVLMQDLAISGENLEAHEPIVASPPEYISALFDSYADHYDAHLVGELNYQAPKLIYQMLERYRPSQANLKILDLGCGTGLCGEWVKSISQWLVGVDLSPNMLIFAKSKGIYDELVQSEILLYLETKHHSFDLILAGDVLVYFGELAELFTWVSIALCPNGLFAFTAEILTGGEFAIADTGRFKHSKHYIETEINKHSLQVMDYQVICVRTQNAAPIHAHLYLLKKLNQP